MLVVGGPIMMDDGREAAPSSPWILHRIDRKNLIKTVARCWTLLQAIERTYITASVAYAVLCQLSNLMVGFRMSNYEYEKIHGVSVRQGHNVHKVCFPSSSPIAATTQTSPYTQSPTPQLYSGSCCRQLSSRRNPPLQAHRPEPCCPLQPHSAACRPISHPSTRDRM